MESRPFYKKKRKKCKKAMWITEKVLQITEERREVKGMGKRQKYTQLNAEFQRISGEIIRSSSMTKAKK